MKSSIEFILYCGFVCAALGLGVGFIVLCAGAFLFPPESFFHANAHFGFIGCVGIGLVCGLVRGVYEESLWGGSE